MSAGLPNLLSKVDLHYWQYFVVLEADLATTARYVEWADPNMDCYSIEFARILLSAGSEVDVLCKLLCQKYSLTIKPSNINGYRKAITTKFPNFTGLEIKVPRYDMNLLPWEDWNRAENPTWWRAYSDVKHERQNNFAEENLRNALEEVAGLFVLVSYICYRELHARAAIPWPQMLTLDPSLSPVHRTDMRPGYRLSDFDVLSGNRD
jgi:hypothetical protein